LLSGQTREPTVSYPRIAFLTALVTVIAASASVEAQREIPGFSQRNQAGVRLGVWAGQGDDAPERGDLFVDGEATGTFETSISSSAFYFEAFYGHQLGSGFMGEVSLGMVNRGSVTLQEGSAQDIGNMMVYGLQISTKYYPDFLKGGSIFPYLQAGGGVYIGHRTVQFTNAGFSYSNWEEETGFTANYVVGAGADISLATNIGMDITAKYVPIKFSKALVTIKDFSTVTVTVGVKYLIDPK